MFYKHYLWLYNQLFFLLLLISVFELGLDEVLQGRLSLVPLAHVIDERVWAEVGAWTVSAQPIATFKHGARSSWRAFHLYLRRKYRRLRQYSLYLFIWRLKIEVLNFQHIGFKLLISTRLYMTYSNSPIKFRSMRSEVLCRSTEFWIRNYKHGKAHFLRIKKINSYESIISTHHIKL